MASLVQADTEDHRLVIEANKLAAEWQLLFAGRSKVSCCTKENCFGFATGANYQKREKMPTPEPFERWQFAGMKQLAVSTDTCISYEDYKLNMHTFTHGAPFKRSRPVPEWVFSDEGFREAVLLACERRLYLPKPPNATHEER